MPNRSIAGRGMAVLVMLATVATIAVNFLAATGRINGVRPDEISAHFPTVLTPAGWAFSIWSLIYIGLIAFSVFQLLPARIEQFRPVRIPYLISCVLNCAWIVLWHHWHVGLCGLVILSLLVSLLWINAKFAQPGSFVEALMTKAVFGLYAGWVTVATLVNLLVYLVSIKVEMSPAAWNAIGIACLILAMVASVLATLQLRNHIYPLAVSWAAAAIGANQSGNTAVVVATAIVCIGCLIISGSVVTQLRDSTS